MILGVNEQHEIMSVNGEPPSEGLTEVEVDDNTFGGRNPLDYRIRIGDGWQEITPKYPVINGVTLKLREEVY